MVRMCLCNDYILCDACSIPREHARIEHESSLREQYLSSWAALEEEAMHRAQNGTFFMGGRL